jgi:hypothetical protein
MRASSMPVRHGTTTLNSSPSFPGVVALALPTGIVVSLFAGREGIVPAARPAIPRPAPTGSTNKTERRARRPARPPSGGVADCWLAGRRVHTLGGVSVRCSCRRPRSDGPYSDPRRGESGTTSASRDSPAARQSRASRACSRPASTRHGSTSPLRDQPRPGSAVRPLSPSPEALARHCDSPQARRSCSHEPAVATPAGDQPGSLLLRLDCAQTQQWRGAVWATERERALAAMALSEVAS